MVKFIYLLPLFVFLSACNQGGNSSNSKIELPTSPSLSTDTVIINQFYPINSGHSYVGFSIRYMGFAKVRGRFADFSGSFRFDPNDVTKTSATAYIHVASLDTDHDTRDSDLKSDNWFDAEKYPLIKFQSIKTVKTEAGFDMVGNLTIKDVTKKTILHIDYVSGIQKDVRGDEQVVFNASTKFDRKLFDVKGENWSAVKEGITAVASEVEVELTILGKQLKEANVKNWVKVPESPQGKIYNAISQGGVNKGIDMFTIMRSAKDKNFNSRILNEVGYLLLKQGKVDDAIILLKHNAALFTNDKFVYNYLGEAYATKGNIPIAKKYYEQALIADSLNVNAIEILRHFP
jgi:polyisoprenoid-binding protein YceI